MNMAPVLLKARLKVPFLSPANPITPVTSPEVCLSFFRTGLPGFRKAAYHGVLYGALATLGLMVAQTMPAFELLGLGLILAALFLQGKTEREKVWKDEGTLERFFGSVPLRRANKK